MIKAVNEYFLLVFTTENLMLIPEVEQLFMGEET